MGKISWVGVPDSYVQDALDTLNVLRIQTIGQTVTTTTVVVEEAANKQ
jgi:hypothetical protein